uniref:Uncharacterized protein n=1 Tax=Siphoviridae sp. ct5co22 TaxID=2826294 RepID=A0A8S5QVF9_9CAUD|nr:MAG TPA: hypothetical protein [Siphoviridae sp. ct5co22]
MSSKLIYQDVAVGAAEDAAVTASSAHSMSDVSLLPVGANTPPLCIVEHNFWRLNGTHMIYDGQAISFLSSAVSGSNCEFSETPKIRVDFDNNYTTLGISLKFSPDTGDYCKQVTITWYQGETQLASQVFTPDSANYFCEKTVSAFNRVDISLDKTSLPLRRARLDQIVFGIIREFRGNEIGSVTIKQEVDPISAELAINYLDWMLRSNSDTEYIFQLKQPVETYHNNELVGVFYVDKIPERTGVGDYSVECQDALGVLDNYEWSGKIYTADTAFSSVVNEIVGGAFEVDIETSLASATIKGYIPDGTRREALQQAAFIVGAAVDTSKTNKIRFFVPQYENPTTLPDRDVFEGGSVKQDAIVTAVIVTYHTYTQGSGNSGDEVITVNDVKYVHTTGTVRIDNPNVTASDKQNIKTVQDATLVNADNAQAVAQRVYNYWMRRKTVETSIVWEEQDMLDYITVPTPWGQDMTGSLTSAKIILSNLTVAEIEVMV